MLFKPDVQLVKLPTTQRKSLVSTEGLPNADRAAITAIRILPPIAPVLQMAPHPVSTVVGLMHGISNHSPSNVNDIAKRDDKYKWAEWRKMDATILVLTCMTIGSILIILFVVWLWKRCLCFKRVKPLE